MCIKTFAFDDDDGDDGDADDDDDNDDDDDDDDDECHILDIPYILHDAFHNRYSLLNDGYYTVYGDYE